VSRAEGIHEPDGSTESGCASCFGLVLLVATLVTMLVVLA
jgi:hypothetical protein